MRSGGVEPEPAAGRVVDRQNVDVEGIVTAARRARAATWRRLVRGAFAGAIRHLRDHWIEPARRARRQKADLKALSALDARMLDDLGLRRADIRAAADGTVPFTRAVARRAAVHVDRVGTVAPFPTASAGPLGSRDLDAAA